jgi:serine/threonine-protein kinase
VRELIRRALVKNPAARIADGAAFVAAIDDVVAGRALPAAPATVVPAAAAVPPSRSASDTGGAARSVARPPAPRRRARVGMVLLPLLALLAGAGIAAAVLQVITDGSAPAAAAAAAEQRQNGSIVLDADNYVGRSVDVVAEKLTGLGLTVRLREQVTDGAVPDRVTGIDPAGTPLSSGDTVVVSYAVAPSDTGRRSGGAPAVTRAAVGDETTATSTESGSGATSTTRTTDDVHATTLPAEPTGTEATGTEATDTSTETSSSETTTSSSSTGTTTASEGDESDSD